LRNGSVAQKIHATKFLKNKNKRKNSGIPKEKRKRKSWRVGAVTLDVAAQVIFIVVCCPNHI
jgi:hypothetical protein